MKKAAIMGLAISMVALLPVGRAGATQVLRIPVTFTVQNVNPFDPTDPDEAALACDVDGKTYEINGHLVAPPQLLAFPRSVTLYLHGATVGEFQFHDPGWPTYDYAGRLAEGSWPDYQDGGHASVVIDRLGFDSSGHPNGFDMCGGGEVNVIHQVLRQLRHGTYDSHPGPSPAFDRVALAGQSSGGLMANVVASMFPDDIDALVVVAWADVLNPVFVAKAANGVIQQCEIEGGRLAEKDDPTSPGGYWDFWDNAEDVMQWAFYDPDERAAAAEVARVNRNPCGIDESNGNTSNADGQHQSEIRVPVLLLCGDHDKIVLPESCPPKAAGYSGSSDVTYVELEDTGHEPTREKTAPVFQRTVAEWLAVRSF